MSAVLWIAGYLLCGVLYIGIGKLIGADEGTWDDPADPLWQAALLWPVYVFGLLKIVAIVTWQELTGYHKRP